MPGDEKGNGRQNDLLIMAELKHIKETTDRTDGSVKALQDDNKRQWQRLEEHGNRLVKIETKEETKAEMKAVPKTGFDYKNLKYIVPAVISLIAGIVGIIMYYQNSSIP
jgi:hypothetical protein